MICPQLYCPIFIVIITQTYHQFSPSTNIVAIGHTMMIINYILATINLYIVCNPNPYSTQNTTNLTQSTADYSNKNYNIQCLAKSTGKLNLLVRREQYIFIHICMSIYSCTTIKLGM